jgi:hypothetical protein
MTVTVLRANAGEEPVQPRIVVDASNVCLAERDERGRPRLNNLLKVRARLNELGFEATMICDANLKYSIDDGDGFQQLIARGDLQQVPAGTDADVFILDAAAQLGALVLSNDVYRPYHRRFPWIDERRIPFMVMRGEVLIPDLAVGPVRPLRGAEPSVESSSQTQVTLTEASDRLRSLVQALIAENEGLRAQREQLLAACDDLHAQQASAAAAAAEATSASCAARSEVAALESHRGELAASLSEARTQLVLERERAAAAEAEKERLEHQAAEFHEREVSLRARVSALDHTLAAMRPDAQLEQKVDRLLRDTVRTLKAQAEPINRTLQQAVETRNAVVAMQGDTRSLAQHAEAISTFLAREHDVEGASAVGECTPSVDKTWSTRYPRVERAWLAAQPVGDPSEAASFMKVVEALRRVDRALDDDRLLEQIDALAARVGEAFSYAALWDAVRMTHRPSLDSGVLLTRTREAVRAASGARANPSTTKVDAVPEPAPGDLAPTLETTS